MKHGEMKNLKSAEILRIFILARRMTGSYLPKINFSSGHLIPDFFLC